ncbi:MAG: hypothetical protein SFU86_06560 [Pirellulaceae bacterium]|nr:hypothetical protein [Pirellulaceae bacterium]
MMTTLPPAPEQVLQQTMTRLEQALLAPVVGGELQQWIGNVQLAAATFATDWTRYLCTVLHQEYAQIAGTDPELLGVVQQMMRVDRQLLEDFARFQEDLHKLCCRAQRVEKHESKVAEQRQALEETGLRLIVSIKRQQAAADTWLAEALYRDRGVGD